MNKSNKIFKQFEIDQFANIGGTSLSAYLSESQQETIEYYFNPVSGFKDDSKGYDGFEYPFVDTAGRLYNCYRRWGSMRVGSKGNASVKDFLAWVDQIGRLRLN